MSIDPLAELQEETRERMSIDLPVSAVEFVERFAAYRNALNVAQGLSVKKWTKKATAEAFELAQIRQVQESMAAAFAEFGALPAANDEKAMLAYARRILASSLPKKQNR